MTNAVKINSLKNRLIRLREIVQWDCPDLIEMLPSPDDIDITKLGVHAGLIMTDSCNAAQKARRLLQHKIGGNVYKLDCHHQLHNVWIKGMEQSVSSYLRVIVTNSLEKIPPKL
jgi:hypothetical protein